jgi:hypothetical protein
MRAISIQGQATSYFGRRIWVAVAMRIKKWRATINLKRTPRMTEAVNPAAMQKGRAESILFDEEFRDEEDLTVFISSPPFIETKGYT